MKKFFYLLLLLAMPVNLINANAEIIYSKAKSKVIKKTFKKHTNDNVIATAPQWGSIKKISDNDREILITHMKISKADLENEFIQSAFATSARMEVTKYDELRCAETWTRPAFIDAKKIAQESKTFKEYILKNIVNSVLFLNGDFERNLEFENSIGTVLDSESSITVSRMECSDTDFIVEIKTNYLFSNK